MIIMMLHRFKEFELKYGQPLVLGMLVEEVPGPDDVAVAMPACLQVLGFRWNQTYQDVMVELIKADPQAPFVIGVVESLFRGVMDLRPASIGIDTASLDEFEQKFGQPLRVGMPVRMRPIPSWSTEKGQVLIVQQIGQDSRRGGIKVVVSNGHRNMSWRPSDLEPAGAG